MAIIAVAGGTSPTLGRSIITAIANTTFNTPVILSRLDNDTSKPQAERVYDAEVRYVDYTSHSSLVSALQGVETVISVIKIPGPDWLTYQLNLLDAAKAAGVKRFAPSEYEMGPAGVGKVDVLGLKPLVWEACEESGLEVARFCCGMFMDYLGLGLGSPGLGDGGEEAQGELMSGFEDEPVIWDVQGGKAELPVKQDGTFPRLTLTRIGDIGRFVAGACALPLGKWEATMSMVGETVGVDEVVGLLEEATGKKFEVTNVGAGELERRAHGVEGMGVTREEIFTKMIAQIELVALMETSQACILEPVVNRLCPDVKPYSVAAYLEQLYG